MANEFIARNGIISKSNLVVSGSLTALSTITAQTLVVQTITSSISSITGSTNFGTLSSNTHTFTGSMSVSGSGTFAGSATIGNAFTIQGGTGLTKHYFTSAGTGDALNQLYDNTGTVKVQLYTNGDSYLNGGKVGIGTTTPQAFLHIAGQNGTNTLTLGTSNNYEIFITGSDSANIYHASPNQAIYLNTNGGPLYLGTSAASTLLTVTGSNVGIGTTTPTATLQVRGPNATGIFFDAQNAGAGGAVFSRINASSSPYNQYLFNNGYVGIGRTPLAQLAVLGGAVQIMGDYPNWQTIIKSAGANGTFSGQLTITIPQMSDGNVDGYGGYSCEVYVAGFEGWYCHAWFSGYINGGITSSEATILRSNGGWSISQASFGANNQGFQFIVNYPTPYIVHPTARIIFNKGGSPNSAEYPANSITAVFS